MSTLLKLDSIESRLINSLVEHQRGVPGAVSKVCAILNAEVRPEHSALKGVVSGLLGHSDADVLVHAVMDALLGAAALGDIGKHFPDTDPAYKGISSILLLQKVGELLEEHCFLIENIDATIIAQAPKMRPHIDQMRQNMADALKIDVSQINVKATTEEGLGFTGAGEGISAQAICLLNSPMGLYDQNVTSGCGGCGGCGVQ